MTSRFGGLRSRLLLAAFTVVVVLLVASAWLVPSLVLRAIETEGSLAMGTRVSAESCTLAPLSGIVRVGGITVESPVAGDERPLARIREIEVALPSLARLGMRELFIRYVAVRGVEISAASTTSGDSAAATIQDNVRAADLPDAGASAPWLERIGVGRVSIHDLIVTATESGAGASDFEIEQVDAEDLAIPVADPAGALASGVASLRGAALTTTTETGRKPLASIGRARAAFRVARADTSGDSLVLDSPSLEVEQPAIVLVSDGAAVPNLLRLVEIWSAALRGLELPSVRSARIADVEVTDGELELERPVKPSPLRLTDIDIRGTRLSWPESDGPQPEFKASARPFAESAAMELHVSGRLLSGKGTKIHARATNLPVHQFPAFHLRRGQAYVSSDILLDGTSIAGPLTVRLEGADVDPGAPLTMKTAYATLAASTVPELTVPLKVDVRDVDEAALAVAVAKAIAERAGKDAGKIVGGAAYHAGAAARGAGERIGGDLKKGLGRLRR